MPSWLLAVALPNRSSTIEARPPSGEKAVACEAAGSGGGRQHSWALRVLQAQPRRHLMRGEASYTKAAAQS